MTSPGLGSGRGTAIASFQKVVEPPVLRVHLRTPHRVRYDRGRLRCPMSPACRGHEPVVMISRHQHQLTPSMPGDLHRLTLGLVLEFAKLALKLHGGCL